MMSSIFRWLPEPKSTIFPTSAKWSAPKQMLDIPCQPVFNATLGSFNVIPDIGKVGQDFDNIGCVVLRE
jgi:hypothetical protein